MSEPEKPKRRWFQFHLLTMVLMTLTAGILIFVNLTGAAKGSSLAADGIDYAYVRGPGWPEPFYFGRRHNLRFDEVETLERDLLTQYSRPKYFFNLAIDIIANATILIIIGFLSEYCIRRREARKI